jgi:hypothetical protein
MGGGVFDLRGGDGSVGGGGGGSGGRLMTKLIHNYIDQKTIQIALLGNTQLETTQPVLDYTVAQSSVLRSAADTYWNTTEWQEIIETKPAIVVLAFSTTEASLDDYDSLISVLQTWQPSIYLIATDKA